MTDRPIDINHIGFDYPPETGVISIYFRPTGDGEMACPLFPRHNPTDGAGDWLVKMRVIMTPEGARLIDFAFPNINLNEFAGGELVTDWLAVYRRFFTATCAAALVGGGPELKTTIETTPEGDELLSRIAEANA